MLDEPLSNLDARLREDMQVELIEIHKRLGLTTLFVTHDQEEALSLSDRIVLLNSGRIVQEDVPSEIYWNPSTEYTSSFIGAANLLPVVVEDCAGQRLALLPDKQYVEVSPDQRCGPATLVLRQEDLVIRGGSSQGLLATVQTRVFLGARNRYVLDLAGVEIKALAANDNVFDAGDTVSLSFNPERLRVIPR